MVRSSNISSAFFHADTACGLAFSSWPGGLTSIVPTAYPGPIEQIVSNLINSLVLHGFDGRDHGVPGGSVFTIMLPETAPSV
jgi:hypothetical protein